MRKIISIATVFMFVLITSCISTKTNHADFDTNVEVAKTFMKLHEAENYTAQADLLHDELLWQPPMYGSEQYGKVEHVEAMKMYQEAFDNITYTADNWLPGVNADTGIIDGSVRTYGTWTGLHVATDKPFSLTSYHTMDFKDGKIIGGGDYFDFGGFFSSLQVEE
jgi:hypothetical protein